MDDSDNFSSWKDRIAWGMIAGTVGLSVLWSAWITNEVFEKTDAAKVEKMIIQNAPYMKDRALIIQTMEDARLSGRELRGAIENNTKAIISLQSLLKQLNKENERANDREENGQ